MSQTGQFDSLGHLAARGESLAAFDGRCIPAGGVAPRSNTPGILGRRALPAGRLARLAATPDFHHGLVAKLRQTAKYRGASERRIFATSCAAATAAAPKTDPKASQNLLQLSGTWPLE